MFIINKLSYEDIKSIITLQKETVRTLKDKSLFYPAHTDELECIIKYTGHAIGLYCNELLIGYATIIYCSKDDQLSQMYGIPDKYMHLTAILDDVAILSQHRGKRYQLFLWNYIITYFCSDIYFLLTSIHPDNIASLKNAFYFDMIVISIKKMYNNAIRYVLLKSLMH